MKTSVALFCVGGLALSAMIALHGRYSRTGETQNIVPPADKPVVAPTPPGKNDAHGLWAAPAIFPVIPDTASLLQQIQNALCSDQPGDQAMIFTNQLLALIQADPWAAARFAESPGAGDWRTELMRTVAQNWAKSDPDSAVQWVARLADSDERDTILSCVCFQVADANPHQAIEILEQQDQNNRRDMMLGNLAQQWAAQDLEATIAWANNYPPGENRDNLFRHIALAESQAKPAAAADLVAGQISPGPIQDEAAISVLQRWAGQDFTAAAGWVDLFPPGGIYDRAKDTLTGIAAAAQPTDVPLRTLQ